MTRSAVLASIFLLALAPAARSQNAWRDILEHQMTAVGNTVSGEGYHADTGAFHTDMIVGTLQAGASVGLEVDLESGVEYMIVGVCDNDCTDLDLSLVDLQGNVLFEDTLDDDAPILRFTAPAGGAHFLDVHMYACSVEPCSFGYKVYRR
jgi:hypothetical protein